MTRDDPSKPVARGLVPKPLEPSSESLHSTSRDSASRDSASRDSASRDSAAWLRSVFDRLQRPLLAYASKLLHGDSELAQDCVQEAFVRLCREPRERIESHVDAWLFKTCRHRAMDIHRMEARMKTQTEPAAIDSLCSHEKDPGNVAMLAEQRNEIERRIAGLPRLEQEVVQLRLGQDLSYKQIAEIMDLSVSHVGVLIHQALTRLREMMSSERNCHS